MELTFLTSLKIVFVYAAMKEGMILFPLRRLFESMLSLAPASINFFLRKPLFDCLFCMSSIWGIIFTYFAFDFTLQYLFLILQVAGLNYLLSIAIQWFNQQIGKFE